MDTICKIKAIGTARGTVGWLRSGLTDGSLSLQEGHLKSNGNHGLWLKGPDGYSQFLAAYNQYGLSRMDGDWDKYMVCDDSDRNGGLTDACWDTMMQIAKAWCTACTEALRNEEPLPIKIVRAEVPNA